MLDVVGYVLLGLFLFIAPGFLFSIVLYPKNESLDFWTRAGISVALGAMFVVYAGYTIARVGALQLGPFVGLTLVLCIAFGVLAYIRGGFEVIVAYKRGAFRRLRRLKPKRAPKQPLPQPPIGPQT